MIRIKFQKSAQAGVYNRIISFPDEPDLFSRDVEVPAGLFVKQKTYGWERDIFDLTETELGNIGRTIADIALGKEGIKRFIDFKRNMMWAGIQILESVSTSELASIPWELIHIDDEFISMNPRTPVSRSIDGYESTTDKIVLNTPVKMALLSAMPPDQNPLMIENEQIKFALTIGVLISQNRLEVHEIINCTRDKIASALRENEYDILYFTGHGAYEKGMGFLCLEKYENGKCLRTDLVSSIEFARMIPQDRIPSLVFFNSCQSATSTPGESQYITFRDLGRELIQVGVPDVIATVTPVFDQDSQYFMQCFFENLLNRYSVSDAVARAREFLKFRGLNTFYQYVHLTQSVEKPRVRRSRLRVRRGETTYYFASVNHPSVDANFVGRYRVLSEIESAYKNGAKAVMVAGIGGVGKTAVSAMLEKRLLNHYDPNLRVSKVIWLDLRDQHSIGAFLDQIATILRASGNQIAAIALADTVNVDPLNICKYLHETFQDSALLTIDNCESLLDTTGKPKNAEMLKLVIGLIAHTGGWKALLTTREPFELTIGNRSLFTTYTYHLTSMTYTERVALINSMSIGKEVWSNMQPADKEKVIKEVGGNPYEIELFIRNLTPLSDVESLIKYTHRKTGDYAYLDYYLGRLKNEVLTVLQLLSVFQSPPTLLEIKTVAKIIDGLNNINITDAVDDLVNKGLVESVGDFYVVPPVLVYYLSQQSQYSISGDTYNLYSYEITMMYYFLYRSAQQMIQESFPDSD